MQRDRELWWLDETIHAGREHFDEHSTRRYDAKEDARAAEEVALLEDLGVVSAGSSVVDLGAGTGRFTLADMLRPGGVLRLLRDEDSTFTWLLDPIIERAGFEIVEAEYTDSVLARYVCRKQ